jgi:hypothetical protein
MQAFEQHIPQAQGRDKLVLQVRIRHYPACFNTNNKQYSSRDDNADLPAVPLLGSLQPMTAVITIIQRDYNVNSFSK